MADQETPPRKRQAPRRTRGKPNKVDIHVGSRVRLRRTLLGMSQEKLADALGLTFQQVQKYERGANRIGAGRLYELSRALDVPVSYFFDELDDGRSGKGGSGLSEEVTPYGEDPMSRRETLLLIRAYYGISEAPVRRRLLDLMRSLGDAPASPDEDEQPDRETPAKPS